MRKGIIFMTFGFLLIPGLVGIPLFIWGIVLVSKSKNK